MFSPLNILFPRRYPYLLGVNFNEFRDRGVALTLYFERETRPRRPMEGLSVTVDVSVTAKSPPGSSACETVVKMNGTSSKNWVLMTFLALRYDGLSKTFM